MSSSATDADDIPTDSTPEYRGPYYFGEEEQSRYEEEEEEILRSEDFISGPYLSKGCTVPYNILELDYSYGYNCKKLSNLVAPDENTCVFTGGNVIHFMDINTGELTFRRSYLGGGVAHITCNPNIDYPHLTVAESGNNPPIIIYEWPTLEIVGILKEGASKRYAHINYSPDGEMLVSQGHYPDFLITVWQWKHWRTSPIILRTKSHVHDVYTCMFSPYVPGQITTSGSGHIKFWKMAETFTGLKLKGELGRFGKTEISDIVGIFPMPDEKVISGSEWGNLLVWEAGLIKIEVYRTKRRRCHDGPVLQLMYIKSKGEIWSISQDGWLRAWEYRIIDEADPPDEDRIVQMVPSYERDIPNVHFLSVCKKRLHEEEDTLYFAQDSNGGIWQVDLILRADFEPAQRLKLCHAGPIIDICGCPWGPYVVSLGDDGRMFLYNYKDKCMVQHYQGPAKGRSLLWVPMQLDATGSYLIAGFDDGVVRIINIFFGVGTATIRVTQSIKPHHRPITVITLNEKANIFVSGGEDNTIFIFGLTKRMGEILLIPIGFVNLSAPPSCFTWNSKADNVLLVGCSNGELLEFELPCNPLPYTKISYFLHTLKPVKQCFTTCKAQIRRDIHIAQIEKRKAEKIERKKAEIARIIAENPGMDIDEEIYLQDSEEEEVLEPLHIPEVPNAIFFAIYTSEDTIWLSMGGYDAGYIYEYHMEQEQKEPLKATIIADADDIEMYNYVYTMDNKYMITGMQDGSIRVNRRNPDNFRDLSDYWRLTMHDNFNGRINKMCFSHDSQYFFSCGDDGNLFAYKYTPEEPISPPKLRRTLSVKAPPHAVQVDENYKSLSLEEMMIKAEQDKQLRLANEHKRKLRHRLKELTAKLSSLLDRNCKLPISQRYPLRQFIVDERIMNALDDMLEAKVALEKRKLAYDVEKSTIALEKMKKHYTACLDRYPFTVKAINTNHKVATIVARGLAQKFYETLKNVEEKAYEDALKGRVPPRKEVVAEGRADIQKRRLDLEPFLVGLSPSTIAFKLGSKLTRLLNKYRERKHRKEIRQEEWNELYARKPLAGVNHPDDEIALKIAAETIGDFKLKSSVKYKCPENQKETTVTKYQQLLEARLRVYKNMIHLFNNKVYTLRTKKVRLIQQMTNLTKCLVSIHEELPKNRIRHGPEIPVMTDADFPEKKLEVHINVESDFKTYLQKEKEKIHPKKSHVAHICEHVDWEKEALGIDKLPNVSGNSRSIINHFLVHNSIPYNPFKVKIPMKEENKESHWEKEIKYRRLIKKLDEQKIIIDKMNNMILEFDNEVRQLSKERFSVIMEAAFLDLHILVINQELIIVKDFEYIEKELGEVALQKWTEMMDMKDSMKRMDLRIEAHLYQIDGCQEHIKGIQQTFLTAAKDNKFWDYLRRIFKKKYRPPKIIDPDADESSSYSSESSTESEEDDQGSLDSREIGPIRLDESICPKGCDKELYDYTFALRSQRHEMEKQIAEERKNIDLLKKELEQSAKKMKILDASSQKAQEELEKYQKLKQEKLNEVNCLVLLKLSQMKHLNPDGHSVANLSDCLVFEVKCLRDLYNRVTELQMETLGERGKHRRNKIHLHRMTVDCNFMEKQIADLKNEILQKMITKFGSRVKIDDIEESVLKRMVLRLRISMLNLGKVYEKEIEALRIKYGEKQVELKNIIRENTARLEVLAVLNKEKTEITKLLETQAKMLEKAKTKEEPYYLKDIDKLVSIVKQQQQQIEQLKLEIKILSIKSFPPKPIEHKICEELPEENQLIGDLESLDELFESPERPAPRTKPIYDDLDKQLTEEEIEICITELMQEVVGAAVLTEKTSENIVIKTLAEVIEQVPIPYLKKEASLDVITHLIRGIIIHSTEVDTKTIIQKVSVSTKRHVEEITEIIEMILSKIFEEQVTQDTIPKE